MIAKGKMYYEKYLHSINITSHQNGYQCIPKFNILFKLLHCAFTLTTPTFPMLSSSNYTKYFELVYSSLKRCGV